MEFKKIKFEIIQEIDGYHIYMTNDTRQILNGVYATKQAALQVIEKLKVVLKEALTKHQSRPQVKHTPIPLHTKEQLQIAAMALDEKRAAIFRENIQVLNMATHIVAYAFDELACLFSPIIDQHIKAHYTNAVKQIDKLLDALLQSNIISDIEDYGHCAQAALGIKERMQALITYCYKDDWRMREYENCLHRICPDEWHQKQQLEAGKKIRETIEKSANIKTELK